TLSDEAGAPKLSSTAARLARIDKRRRVGVHFGVPGVATAGVCPIARGERTSHGVRSGPSSFAVEGSSLPMGLQPRHPYGHGNCGAGPAWPPGGGLRLPGGVMVTLEVLVLSFLVRVQAG